MPRRLCYRPAVFFRHIRLTALSFPQGKILFLGAFAKLRKATVSFVMSAFRLSAWNNSAPNGRVFMQVISLFFENLKRKLMRH
jgi:hypothetical protein